MLLPLPFPSYATLYTKKKSPPFSFVMCQLKRDYSGKTKTTSFFKLHYPV